MTHLKDPQGRDYDFASQLRLWRTHRKLTQQALGSSLGGAQDCAKATIYQYESGQMEPTLRRAARLARALGISIDDLLYSKPTSLDGVPLATRVLDKIGGAK